MRIGESRYAAKKARREAGENIWAYSDEVFHSHGSRNTYQQQVLAFIQWARATHGVRRLDVLDQQAEDLAAEYLHEQLDRGLAPDSLKTARSALRHFFERRDLAEIVLLPEREQKNITRGRTPSKRSQEFQPANWQHLLAFVDATGLRDAEVKQVQIEDIRASGPETGEPEVTVKRGYGKGGRPRQVPILPGHEAEVLALRDGRAPEDVVFPRVPSRLHAQQHRRGYAQAYYKQLSGRELPPKHGRLKPSEYDKPAVLKVSRALGHNRIDIVLRNYLR